MPDPTDLGLPDPSAAFNDLLGATEAAVDTADPVSLGRSYLGAMRRAARRPLHSVPAWLRYGAGLGMAGTNLATRVVGIELPGVIEADPSDPRFRDPTWSDNLLFHGLLQAYLLTARLIQDLVEAAGLAPPEGPKAEFAASLLADAISPTNLLFTNPRALKRAFETGGTSVVRGARNFVHDMLHNEGWPSQVDRDSFVLGRNTAATPGKVVFRNELIEVLQYAPTTEEVFERPLVVIPPWINRYYIADLAPGKSLVEWAVAHGHTTFAVSFRNPDRSMRDLSFDDYLRLGPLTAIDVAREISGSETVNTLSICLGGTMTAMVLAYLDACGDHLVHSATYLNSAIDYDDAGALATVFADPATLEGLVRRMEKKGFLPGKDIAHTFDLLRANDLVFRYVVDGWLLGQAPPAFDLLNWNSDNTNMPGARPRRVHPAHVPGERAGARRVRGDGGAPHGLRDRHRRVRRRRGRGPHRAVAVVVPDRADLQGGRALRHDLGWSHRRHRLPPGPEGQPLDQRRAAARTGRVASRRDQAPRHLVERLGGVDRRARRRVAGAAPDRERAAPGDRRRARRLRHQLTRRISSPRCPARSSGTRTAGPASGRR